MLALEIKDCCSHNIGRLSYYFEDVAMSRHMYYLGRCEIEMVNQLFEKETMRKFIDSFKDTHIMMDV